MCTVRELIDLLEDAAQTTTGDDAVIQFATQSHYPLRYGLAGIYVPEDAKELDESLFDSDNQPIVWLVEGSQHRENPYGVPEHAWNDVQRP